MTDKELRKLKRIALIELLIDQMEENERLRASMEDLKQQLRRQEFVLAGVGFPVDLPPADRPPQPPEASAPPEAASSSATPEPVLVLGDEPQDASARVRSQMEEIQRALGRASASSAPFFGGGRRVQKREGPLAGLISSKLSGLGRDRPARAPVSPQTPAGEEPPGGGDSLEAALMNLKLRGL